MTEEPSRFSLSPTARRLLRSYGLLIAIAVAFLLMALFIREKPKTVPSQSIGFLQPAHGVDVHLKGALWR